jgi:hypothetical protein
MSPSPTPYEWVVRFFNVQSLSWAGLIYVLYKIVAFLTNVVSGFIKGTDRVLTAEGTLNLIATNHLPHIQAAVEESHKKHDRTNELLEQLVQKLDSLNAR